MLAVTWFFNRERKWEMKLFANPLDVILASLISRRALNHVSSFMTIDGLHWEWFHDIEPLKQFVSIL